MTAVGVSTQVFKEDIRAILARDLPWQELSGKRIVFTGASGFLGGYLVRTLLALHSAFKVCAPPEVIERVRNLSRARAKLDDCADHLQLALMQLVFKSQPVAGERRHDFFPDMTHARAALALRQAIPVDAAIQRSMLWHARRLGVTRRLREEARET